MIASQTSIRDFRTWNKDLGVAIVLAIALVAAFVLSQFVVNRTKTFQDADAPFRFEYPARWTDAESLQDVLLKVEDPTTPSAYKSLLTVEARDLDPSAPPTMQQLVDRRVEQRSALTAYHFISDRDTTVAGVPAKELQYSYVVQPIDTPRRASLPVVVIAREYIIKTETRTYYMTLAAPENDFERASARFDGILNSVKFQ